MADTCDVVVDYRRRLRALMRRGLPISVARALHAAGPAALPQIEELEAATGEQLQRLRDAARRVDRERKSRPGLANTGDGGEAGAV